MFIKLKIRDWQGRNDLVFPMFRKICWQLNVYFIVLNQ